MGILEALRSAETVDFPVAMPPVNPITVHFERYQKQVFVVKYASAPSIVEVVGQV